jgi:hypothetical protein
VGYRSRQNWWVLGEVQVLTGLQNSIDRDVFGPHHNRTPLLTVLGDVGGAAEISRIVDHMLTIGRTPEEREEHMARLYQAKARETADNKTINCHCDFGTGSIYTLGIEAYTPVKKKAFNEFAEDREKKAKKAANNVPGRTLEKAKAKE